MSSKAPISSPTMSDTGSSNRSSSNNNSKLPTSLDITPSSSKLSESSSSASSSSPLFSSALGSASKQKKATNVSWTTAANRIRITLFIAIGIVSCFLLIIVDAGKKDGGSNWMEESLSVVLSFLAFSGSIGSEHENVGSTPPSQLQLALSSPPTMVILLLAGFLILDLTWLHPDVQLRKQKHQQTFSQHGGNTTATTGTTTTAITANNAARKRKPIATTAPPFLSLDAMEDGLTLLFLMLLLGSADQAALSTMTGTLYAILVKMALKVTWHTTMSILNGGGSSSLSSSWNWMDTTSNVFDSSPKRQLSRTSDKDAVGGATTIAITQPPPPPQQQQQQKQHEEQEQERSIGKLASHSNLWLIHGQEYNLADFVQRHPGGKEAILLGQGRDCTALFESYHSFTKQNRIILQKYRPVMATLDHHNADTNDTNDPFYDILRQRVAIKLKEHGIDPLKDRAATRQRIMYYLFVTFCWVCCGWYHITGSILGSFLFALSGWLMGALGHDAGHFAVSRIPWVNEWCVWAMSFISNPIVWQHQHTYAHHSFTNEFESDPDLHHFHLLLRVHERVQIHRKYRKQSHWQYVLYAYMFAIFATCVGIPIVMANKGHLYSVVNWQDKSRPTKNLGLRLHVALYVLFVMVIPLFTNPTPLRGLVAVFVHMVTMGIVFAAFSQINHLTETALQADMDTRRTKKRELLEHTTSIVDDSWAATQVETSNNFAPHSLFWYIVSNGLNHQIEHHLFPGLNHCHLHHIVPVVKRTCEEYGVHYISYESFSSLTAALLTWFEKLSGDHKKKELVKNHSNKAVSQKAQ